jgi:hypothetical protein
MHCPPHTKKGSQPCRAGSHPKTLPQGRNSSQGRGVARTPHPPLPPVHSPRTPPSAATMRSHGSDDDAPSPAPAGPRPQLTPSISSTAPPCAATMRNHTGPAVARWHWPRPVLARSSSAILRSSSPSISSTHQRWQSQQGLDRRHQPAKLVSNGGSSGIG